MDDVGYPSRAKSNARYQKPKTLLTVHISFVNQVRNMAVERRHWNCNFQFLTIPRY